VFVISGEVGDPESVTDLAETPSQRQSRKARGGAVGPERTRRSAVGTLRNGQRLSNADARDLVMKGILHGQSVKDSVKAAGRSYSWYTQQRLGDHEFRDQIDSVRLRTGRNQGISRAIVSENLGRDWDPAEHDPMLLDFPAFCAKYLGQQVFPHTQNIVDMIEGRQPSWLHPAMLYEPGERDLMIANCPPEHAKSVAVTINYVVYRICMDPSVRVIIVSKSQNMAKKMLLAIKNRLTSPRYSHLIATYGPVGGFEAHSDAWTTEMIYVGGRDVEQKDPTVQAIGIRGHLYGARADLIVMDDCVDMTNYLDYDRQIEWIQSEVVSRISANGALLVVGTRLSQVDLYLELRNPERYPDEESPWTYLSMPAVLEYVDEDPSKWLTLWPVTNVADAGDRTMVPDDNGMYPKWDGPRLARKRARVSPQVWARVYQQQQIASDTVFSHEDIRGCVNGARNVGRLPLGKAGTREDGMNGVIVVAGLDPATTGFSAASVIALDPTNYKRYVLDVRNRPNLSPDDLRELIYELTDRYGINEWVIERNGFQGFLAFDREVNEYLRARGCLIRAHFTSHNKFDPDFGVAAMSSLFRGWREGNNLIELPSHHQSEGVKALIEQLTTWAPQAPKGLRTDTVMSLWFAELACQARVEALSAFTRSHARNPFLTKADKSRQQRFSAVEAMSMWSAM
jgi:hypothetical protein